MNSGLQDGLDMDLLLGQLLSNTMATNLIGRNAHVSSDRFTMGSNREVTIGYRLEGQAESVTVNIYDENDELVRTLHPDGLTPNAHALKWDGEDDNGNTVAPGVYRYEVTADGPGESQIALNSYLVGLVEGIRYRDGQAWLVVGDDEFGLGSVIEVMQAEEVPLVGDNGPTDDPPEDDGRQPFGTPLRGPLAR